MRNKVQKFVEDLSYVFFDNTDRFIIVNDCVLKSMSIFPAWYIHKENERKRSTRVYTKTFTSSGKVYEGFIQLNHYLTGFRGEKVRFKNGNPYDYRLENLEIVE